MIGDSKRLTPKPRTRTAHDMEMQMVNFLSTFGSGVGHNSVTTFWVRAAALFQSQSRG